MMLGDAAISGMTNYYTSGMFQANTAAATGGTDSIASQVTTSAGGHFHGGPYLRNLAGAAAVDNTAGAHTHTITVAMTNYLKQVALSAWANAASEVSLAGGMIGMWESATPPDGWYFPYS